MTEKNGIPDQIFWVFMDDLRQGEFDTFLLLCKESLNTLYSDGQQFSQYQQKRIFTSHFKSFNTKKIMIYDVENLGLGLGQTQKSGRFKLVNGITALSP
jgi:hypothetical protein